MTRSTASSNSLIVMIFLFRRAARIAAIAVPKAIIGIKVRLIFFSLN